MHKRSLLLSCLLSSGLFITTSASAMDLDTGLPVDDAIDAVHGSVSSIQSALEGLVGEAEMASDETAANILAASGEEDTAAGAVSITEGVVSDSEGLLGAEERAEAVLGKVDATKVLVETTADNTVSLVSVVTDEAIHVSTETVEGIETVVGLSDLADTTSGLASETTVTAVNLAASALDTTIGVVGTSLDTATDLVAGVDVIGLVPVSGDDLTGLDPLTTVDATVSDLVGGNLPTDNLVDGLAGGDIVGNVSSTVGGLTGGLI